MTIRPKALGKREAVPEAKHPVLNGKYHVTSLVGDGKTSRVYLCESVGNDKPTCAFKLLRDEYLAKD